MMRCMRPEDAAAVLDIYREGIDGRNATFETVVPEWEAWDRRHLSHSRFVFAEDGGAVLGWAALSPYSSREAYAGVGEVSVYVRSGAGGRGIGTQLLGAVVASSEEHGMWTLFSGVFPENGASIRIHLKNGFRILCQRMKVARLDGVWRDTLLLERRSERIV